MAPEAKGGERDSIGSETSEWLAVPGTEREVKPSPEPEPPEQELQPRSLRAQLDEAERELERRRIEIEKMRDRIQRLERELNQRKRPPSPTKATQTTVKAADPTEQLDLNAASYDDLRGIGLSVAESARLIAYRDVREGIGSLEELAEIPGMSPEAVEQVRGRTRVSS
jgi:DNA uptake protein ComE-like DNA-binding protein